jgi:hypothetical protein
LKESSPFENENTFFVSRQKTCENLDHANLFALGILISIISPTLSALNKSDEPFGGCINSDSVDSL